MYSKSTLQTKLLPFGKALRGAEVLFVETDSFLLEIVIRPVKGNSA
jgi:hypothetical protein